MQNNSRVLLWNDPLQGCLELVHGDTQGIIWVLMFTKETDAQTIVEKLMCKQHGDHFSWITLLFRVITEEKKKLSAMVINASVDQLHWTAKPSEIFCFWKRNRK